MRYEVPGHEPVERYEPLLVAALPVAMALGAPIEVAGPVSPRLIAGLSTAKRVLDGWFEDLDPVGIKAPLEPPPAAPDRGVACFFTAGLDSFHTALTHRDRLDALVFVHGFDVPLDDPPHRERVAAVVRRAADGLGLPLVEVETDLRDLSNPHCRWGEEYHGAALASVAHVLSDRFRELLVAASSPLSRLHVWGSHPALDPWWSSEAVELVHDGAVTRVEKLSVIRDSEVALANLRVCFQVGADQLNCGRCEKCLRTMVGLRIVGALERCPTLPDEVPLDELARRPVGEDYLIDRARENLAAAEQVGDADLAAALREMIRNGPRRAAVRRGGESVRRGLRRRTRPLRRGVRRSRRAGARRLRRLRRRARRRR
ncbi:MAG TPA: hypothetical protein VK919_12180 [Solirubrobacterales bacterium]|nr:hypothetical protein [Solirubrobacterales bacterium]